MRWLSLLALLPSLAFAQTITDGDTLKLNGTTYRLWGIDAPETRQECEGWPAGHLAASALQSIIKGKTVTCQAKGHDRYDRTIAKCYANGADIQALMVRRGWAWAFTRYSSDYVSEEAKAKAEQLGIHAHNCLPAWEWRRK